MEAQWNKRFPDIPGWYWCYQALDKNNGESVFPVWVDDNMHLPRNIEAYYGPLTPPEVPVDFVPERYRKKSEETE